MHPSFGSGVVPFNRIPRPDAVRAISDQIKQAIHDEVDPYLLAGALIEGIAMTLLSNIPEQKRMGVAKDVLKLLGARLLSLNMLD